MTMPLPNRVLPFLRPVLDEEALSEVIGSAVRVERVRYKPGTSAVSAVIDAHGSRWWAYAHISAQRVRKQVERAQHRDFDARLIGTQMSVGRLHSDRVLAEQIGSVFAAGDQWWDEETRVLRYNPFRRLVVRQRDHALKFSAAPPFLPGPERALSARAVPVIVPQTVRPGVTRTQWWGEGDLAETTSAQAAFQAGYALSRLHTVDPQQLGISMGKSPESAARAASSAVTALLPGLADRTRALVRNLGEALRSRTGTLLHGDFSADQVLTGGEEIRLIDFDRVCLGATERDLGSFLAKGGNPVLLEGYREGGGVFHDRALSRWKSFALLCGAVEPFRLARQSWPQEVHAQVVAAEEELQ